MIKHTAHPQGFLTSSLWTGASLPVHRVQHQALRVLVQALLLLSQALLDQALQVLVQALPGLRVQAVDHQAQAAVVLAHHPLRVRAAHNHLLHHHDPAAVAPAHLLQAVVVLLQSMMKEMDGR